jgi:hypothetical protein
LAKGVQMPHFCCLDDDISRPARDSLTASSLFVITTDHEAEAQVVMLVPIEYLQ